MNGDFIAGFILGAVITALAVSKSTREGFKSLIVGVWNRIKLKK